MPERCKKCGRPNGPINLDDARVDYRVCTREGSHECKAVAIATADLRAALAETLEQHSKIIQAMVEALAATDSTIEVSERYLFRLLSEHKRLTEAVRLRLLADGVKTRRTKQKGRGE